MSTNNIPQSDSIREAANFWDTHDLTDFEDQIEEVTEPVFEREKVVQIHLSTKDAEAVENLARSQGLNPAALLQSWIVERVQALS